MHAGKGVSGRVGKRPVAIGNRKLLDELCVRVDTSAFERLQHRADEMRAKDETIIYVVEGGAKKSRKTTNKRKTSQRVTALVGVSDVVKDARATHLPRCARAKSTLS